MHISVTEPSSVILSQNSKFQNLERDVPNTENFDALKRYESTEVDRRQHGRTGLHVP